MADFCMECGMYVGQGCTCGDIEQLNKALCLAQDEIVKLQEENKKYRSQANTSIVILEKEIAKLKEELLECGMEAQLQNQRAEQLKSTLDEIESSIDNHNWNMNTESAGLKLINHIRKILAKREDKT